MIRKTCFKTLVLFCSLSLFSCSLGNMLNEKLNLETPLSNKTVKIYANNGTDDFFEYPVEVRYLQSYRQYNFISFCKNNQDFANWVSSLENGNNSVAGFYIPDRRRPTSFKVSSIGEMAECYYNDSLYLLWDDSYDTIKIKANNGSEKTYEYKLFSPAKYNEIVTLDYSEMLEDTNFSAWVSSLSSYSEKEKYAGGFIENDRITSGYGTDEEHYESDPTQYFSVSKCDPFVNLSWNGIPPFDKLTIAANNGSGEEMTVPLDKFYIEKNLSWSDIYSNPNFEIWYNDLKREGYLPVGLSMEENWSIENNNYPECSDYWDKYKTSLRVNCNKNKIYVQWVKAVTQIEIFANNGTNNSYVYKLDKEYLTKDIYWNDLMNDSQFKAWYESLSNGNSLRAGIAYYENYGDLYPSCSSEYNGSVYASFQNENKFYVHWIYKISEITFHPNGTNARDFVYQFGEEFYQKELSWNDLAQNSNFVSWYEGLSKVESVKTGIMWGTSMENGYSSVSPQNPDGTLVVNCKSCEFFVEWKTFFNSIRIYAGNTDGNNNVTDYYTFYLDGYYLFKKITWNDLADDSDFKSWYYSLYRSNYSKNGIWSYHYPNGPINPENLEDYLPADAYTNNFYVSWILY